jgi:hypothetical protein
LFEPDSNAACSQANDNAAGFQISSRRWPVAVSVWCATFIAEWHTYCDDRQVPPEALQLGKVSGSGGIDFVKGKAKMKRRLLATGLILCALSGGYAGAQNTDADGTRTTTATTRNADNDDDFDYGWIGLAGLLGLAGLMGRKRDHAHTTTSTVR